MPDTRTFIHRIDADDIIEYVNEAWVEWAGENWDAEEARRVVGMPMFEYLHSRSVRHVYRVLLNRLRGLAGRVALPYRCDSPDTRRWMEVEIEVLERDAVEFRSRILKEEPRDPVPVLLPETERSEELLMMCSWCKKIHVPPWMEVELAIKDLDLFGEPTMPRLVHTICDVCRTLIENSVPGRTPGAQ